MLSFRGLPHFGNITQARIQALLCFAAFSLFTGTGHTQTLFEVVVTVNQTPITQYEVNTRLALARALGEITSTTAQARKQIEDTLIDESIHLDIAEANGLLPTDAAIDAAFANLATSNGLSVAEFRTVLANGGVSVSSFRARMRAQIAWSNILFSSIGDRADVSDQELAEAWADIQSNRHRTERLLSQIYLPRASARTASAVADRILAGESFAAVARDVSLSPSAAMGGDMGWVRAGELGGGVERELTGLGAGSISAPIPTANGGYFIYAVRQVRPVGAQEVRETFDLGRLFVSLENQGQTQADVEKLTLLEQAFRSVDSCERFDRAIDIYGERGSGQLEGVALGDLPQEIRGPIQALETDQFTQLIPERNGASIYIKCGTNRLSIPKQEDTVRESLRQEKIQTLGEELRIQLRRQAFIQRN